MAQDHLVCESGADADTATETADNALTVDKLGVTCETTFETAVFDLKVDL